MFSCFTLRFARVAALCGVTALLLASPRLLLAAPPEERIGLAGHLPVQALASAQPLGQVPATEQITLAITLPLRDPQGLNDLLTRLYDPDDELYGQYLTPEEFTARFGPTLADYQAVAAYATAQGLTITATHPDRLVLDVVGSAKSVESAFGVRLNRYQLPVSGRQFRSPDGEPTLPVALAGRVQGIIGLDTAAVWHKHSQVRPVGPTDPFDPFGAFVPHLGSGPSGGYAPADIKTAYNLNSASLTGSGQTLGLFELDGYTASDITAYETYFSLPKVTLQNVLVDTAKGTAGSGADEVTLDIELQIALAPGASKILVYEGPNSNTGVIDTYSRIASDNLAKSISTSWGEAEQYVTSSTLNSENATFQKMAAQGQTLYSAAGDSGAYDNGSTLSVDDPASQPYVTGVGGTSLTTNGAGGAWKSETTWNRGSVANGAGGGGISQVWSIPSYQSAAGVITTAAKASSTFRNVPDVALNADPYNGYSIYYQGQWTVYGGTSCAAPLWAAFTALVNQQRIAAGKSTLGFANPAIYAVGTGLDYATDFHDIADGSTNLYYPAVKGYDLATGWGSFSGIPLLNDLAGSSVTGPPPPSQLLSDPGFENGTNTSPWVMTAGVINNSSSEPPHSGSWDAWLDGYGTTHTDTLYQQVAIPSTISKATLTFYLHIDTAETTKTAANDTLTVQVRNSSGTVLTTLATYSNLNAAAGYTQKTFDLSAYKGQTIQIYLNGTENSSKQTSFVVDDFALNVQ